MRTTVFIDYSHTDGRFIYQLVDKLKTSGVVVWTLSLVILSSCSSTTNTPLVSSPQATTSPTSTLTPTPTALPTDQAFVEEIYHRLNVDDTIPSAGRESTISLFTKRPTLFFPKNNGLVLVYDVPAVPESQEETTQAAVMLIGTAVGVAAEQGVELNGVEVVFYHGDEPFIGFKATPPWDVKDILAAPLADELIDSLEEKGAATVTPTSKPTLPSSTS